MSKTIYFICRSQQVALQQRFYPANGQFGEFQANPKYCSRQSAHQSETGDNRLEWKRKWTLRKFGTKSCLLIKGESH